eukprot:scaffold6.g2821.t1
MAEAQATETVEQVLAWAPKQVLETLQAAKEKNLRPAVDALLESGVDWEELDDGRLAFPLPASYIVKSPALIPATAQNRQSSLIITSGGEAGRRRCAGRHSEGLGLRCVQEAALAVALEQLGLTVFVGVASCCLLAKLASATAKPDGVRVVAGQAAAEVLLGATPARRLPDCRSRLADAFAQRGRLGKEQGRPAAGRWTQKGCDPRPDSAGQGLAAGVPAQPQEGLEVDLAAADTAEQHRILRLIEAARRGPSGATGVPPRGAGGGGGKCKGSAGKAAGGDAKQPKITVFFKRQGG